MMIDLYHRTSAERAREIERSGRFVSLENTSEVYFSNRRRGQAEGYGVAVVHVRIPESLAELDDEFPDGELHYRVRAHHILRGHIAGIDFEKGN